MSKTCGIRVSEAQAEQAVVELFELYGWKVYRLREDITRGVPGVPDLLAQSKCNMELWVELKRPPSSRNPRGHVRAAQIRWLIEARRRGVPCCVLDGASESATAIAEEFATGSMLHSYEFLLQRCDVAMVQYAWWPVK